MDEKEILKDLKEKHGIADYKDEKSLLSLIRYACHIGYDDGWKDAMDVLGGKSVRNIHAIGIYLWKLNIRTRVKKNLLAVRKESIAQAFPGKDDAKTSILERVSIYFSVKVKWEKEDEEYLYMTFVEGDNSEDYRKWSG